MIKKPGDYSINIGSMKRGPKNNIADVRGVKVFYADRRKVFLFYYQR